MELSSGETVTASRRMLWVDRSGTEELLNVEPNNCNLPRISPDGGRVAIHVRGVRDEIVIWDFIREKLEVLTLTEELVTYPVWTPDGKRIAYWNQGSHVISWKSADGSGVAEPIVDYEAGGNLVPYFFSPEGTELVFLSYASDYIHMVSIGGNSKPETLLEGAFRQANAELSPDGHWMAYQSDESGRPEIYVRPFPKVNEGLERVSNAGGIQPLWARSGRELFYLEPGTPRRLIAVPVQTGPTFDKGNPQVLIDWKYPLGTGGAGRNYDVSLDGQRFLIKDFADEGNRDDPPHQIVVVQNWFEELKRLVPTNN